MLENAVSWLDQRFYPQCQDNWDDKLFARRIADGVEPSMVVLDLGAGAGIVTEMNFRGRARRVCGIDLDPRVTDNPYLDEGHVADAEHIPYEDRTFDLVFSDNVMEHLSAPDAVFREVKRVLKPGGRLLFKTPNRRHYMPAIARHTPHWFHAFYNRLRGRASEDTFPTLYRANTPEDVAALAAASGFRVRLIELVEQRPEYLRISPLTYPIGIAYERLVNSVEAMSKYRILLIADLELPAE